MGSVFPDSPPFPTKVYLYPFVVVLLQSVCTSLVGTRCLLCGGPQHCATFVKLCQSSLPVEIGAACPLHPLWVPIGRGRTEGLLGNPPRTLPGTYPEKVPPSCPAHMGSSSIFSWPPPSVGGSLLHSFSMQVLCTQASLGGEGARVADAA
jgi:hypothetical protein